MGEVTWRDRNSVENWSEKVGFVSSIEEWAKKHGLNVFVAVYEHKAIKESIVSEIKQKDASSVLDIGCGYGFLISRLNEACPNLSVTGTDISRYQIMNAKSRMVRGALVVCCSEYMPFRSDGFNFIVCSEVIEHTVNPKSSLLEMERMLKKNGYLCISTDNPLSIYRKTIKLISRVLMRKKSFKEEFIPSAKLTEMIPNTIKVRKVMHLCPYSLLPMVGPFGFEIIGKAWVSLAQVIEKLPYVGKQFYNKYIVFCTKHPISLQAYTEPKDKETHN